MKNKAIFFDRDGIVNVKIENGYVTSIGEFKFIDAFFSLFKSVKEQGYLTILITNQQCISKNLLAENELQKIHNYMQNELINKTNNKFDAIYYCGDLADSGSAFRKPEVGMFLAAINDFNIDVEKSWTIGDSITDVIAGKNVGTKTILVGNYNDTDDSLKINELADYIFPSVDKVFLTNKNEQL